jgi:hypothetical protein
MPPPLRAGGMAAERDRRLPRGGPEFISTSGPKFIVTAKQQASLLNPPVRMPDLLALFERLGLTHTVTELHGPMAA